MAGIIAFLISVAVLIGVLVALIGLRPDCPAGTVGVFYQYSGWACVAGAKP